MTDWKTLAAARGLRLSEGELSALAAVMESLEPDYRTLVAGLTHDIEPATTLDPEAVEAR